MTQICSVTAPIYLLIAVGSVLGKKYGQAGFCAAALLATRMLSFFTMSALLWVLKAPPMWSAGAS
jgi:hypothetical protein